MPAALRPVPDRPPRAVAYIRVSKEREDMISPELQETAIRDHCARNGYELVEIITDLDLSGRFWKRRQVERAIAMIEAREVELVVVWKTSRVARNRLDWAIALDRVDTAGGRLESATEPNDVTTSSGRFSRGILAELAAFESERAGEQWQETHRRRWSQGRPHSGKPRLGYTYDREHGYQPDPETAPLVVEMYRRAIAGEGIAKIADWLRGTGVTTITSGRGVRYFLRIGFAAGWLDHHDPACRGPHRNVADCPNRIREHGTHEPIIDQVTFDAYLAVAEERRTLPPRLVSPVSTLSGILICAGCSNRMSRKTARDEGSFFRCATRGCPQPITYREAKAEQLVVDWLPTVAALVDARARELGAGDETLAAEADALARTVTRAEKALEKLTIDYARGDVPAIAYAAARDALLAERDAASKKHARVASAVADVVKSATIATALLAAWVDMTPEQRNRMLRELCVIEVAKGEKRPEAVIRGTWEAPAF